MEKWARNARLRLRSLGRVGWVVGVVYVLALLVMVGWAEFGWEDAYKTRPVDEIVYLVCLVGAAACAGLAFRSARGRKRYGWLASC